VEFTKICHFEQPNASRLGSHKKMSSSIKLDITRPLLLEIAWEVANKGLMIPS
jgi:hypothetical protein